MQGAGLLIQSDLGVQYLARGIEDTWACSRGGWGIEPMAFRLLDDLQPRQWASSVTSLICRPSASKESDKSGWMDQQGTFPLETEVCVPLGQRIKSDLYLSYVMYVRVILTQTIDFSFS